MKKSSIMESFIQLQYIYFHGLLTINFINIQVFKYDYLQNNKKLHRIFTGVLKGNMMWFEPPKENDYKCI